MTKVAIITGASSGIGRSLAIQGAKNGYHLSLFARNIAALNELKAEIHQFSNVNILITQGDVSVQNDCLSLINNTIQEFGKIDFLINNAGITKDNLLMRMSEADFDQVINVNLKSVFNMTKAIQKTFLKKRSGSIINISSVVGVSGNAGQTNYAASKAGAIGFTKSVALELGSRNIRCNAIAPGFIETEMTAKLSEEVVKGWREGIPLKRGGTTEDVANACLFLASDMSAYITGQVLSVCGGMLT